MFHPKSCSVDFDSVQRDVSTIEHRLEDNFLTFNAAKCKYMIISRKISPFVPNCPLTLNSQHLQIVHTYRYLGITLSSGLSWTPHVEIICKRACKVLGVLYWRFSTFSSSANLLYFYKSLFWPHVEYTSPARILHIFKDIHEIEDVQNFALRKISLR